MNSNIIVESVSDIISNIKSVYSNANLNYLLWFRGHADDSWDLIPSVQRGNFARPTVEQYMSNDFYMRTCVATKDIPRQDYWIGHNPYLLRLFLQHTIMLNILIKMPVYGFFALDY